MSKSQEDAATFKITETLVALIRERAAKGLAKYGTTLDRTDLTPAEWIQHTVEELLDGAGYLLALQAAATGRGCCGPVAAACPNNDGVLTVKWERGELEQALDKLGIVAYQPEFSQHAPGIVTGYTPANVANVQQEASGLEQALDVMESGKRQTTPSLDTDTQLQDANTRCPHDHDNDGNCDKHPNGCPVVWSRVGRNSEATIAGLRVLVAALRNDTYRVYWPGLGESVFREHRGGSGWPAFASLLEDVAVETRARAAQLKQKQQPNPPAPETADEDTTDIDVLRCKADAFDEIWEVCVELGMEVHPPGLDEDGVMIDEPWAMQYGFIRELAAQRESAARLCLELITVVVATEELIRTASVINVTHKSGDELREQKFAGVSLDAIMAFNKKLEPAIERAQAFMAMTKPEVPPDAAVMAAARPVLDALDVPDPRGRGKGPSGVVFGKTS